MGCCLVVIIGAIWPRIVLVCLYFFTTIPQRAFHTMMWPLLGFLFLPTTTLAYEVAVTQIGPMDNIWSIVLVVLAFLHDLGQFGAMRKRRKS